MQAITIQFTRKNNHGKVVLSIHTEMRKEKRVEPPIKKILDKNENNENTKCSMIEKYSSFCLGLQSV